MSILVLECSHNDTGRNCQKESHEKCLCFFAIRVKLSIYFFMSFKMLQYIAHCFGVIYWVFFHVQ